VFQTAHHLPSRQQRIDVQHVRNILIALICLSPLILVWDKLIVQGLLAGFVSAALAITALTLLPSETAFLALMSRAPIVVAAIPGIWVLIQILPLWVLAHPIWKSAETALQRPIAGSISVDPGASIVALGYYLTIASAAFLSAAVAVDRRRAEWLLYALSAAASVIAVVAMVVPDNWLSGALRTQAIDCASLGTIFAAAACIRSIEHYETRRFSSQRSKVILVRDLIIFGAAFAICCAAVLFIGGKQAIFATLFGLSTLGCVTIIRRFGLGLFGIGGMVVLGIVIVIVAISVQPTRRGTSIVFGYASELSSTTLGQRMLEDAPLAGTGAGTFRALASIYREMNDSPSSHVASTATGTLAIELGTPMLSLILAVTVIGVVALLRASLQRGRDSFYSAMAGAALITLLLLAFTNAGLLGSCPGLIAAVTIGLGLAQSKSRIAHG
jgi:hypothetical protein